MKMDCEGAEFEILYSTSSEYLKRVEEIRLEYHDINDKNYNIENLIRFLEKNSFELVKFVELKKGVGVAWFKKEK